MVNYSPQIPSTPPTLLDAIFGALSDPTRRAILARLAQGEATVSELAAPFNVSLPAVSKHLRVLESAGLLRREIDGRIHRCRLAPEPMKDAARWIEHYRVFWENQFDALAKFLESPNKQEEKSKWQHLRHPKEMQDPDSRSRSAAPSPRRLKGSSPRGRNPIN
jgi:DNA-binding transcriptional ArsR family regulator